MLDGGAIVTVKLTCTHYRRSVLVQESFEIIAPEKNKRILAHYLDLVKEDHKDISPAKEIIVGSFLASEESQKTEANKTVQFSVVKRTAQKKKVETISQDSKMV